MSVQSPVKPWLDVDVRAVCEELEDVATMLREAGRTGPLRDEVADLLVQVAPSGTDALWDAVVAQAEKDAYQAGYRDMATVIAGTIRGYIVNPPTAPIHELVLGYCNIAISGEEEL